MRKSAFKSFSCYRVTETLNRQVQDYINLSESKGFEVVDIRTFSIGDDLHVTVWVREPEAKANE